MKFTEEEISLAAKSSKLAVLICFLILIILCVAKG